MTKNELNDTYFNWMCQLVFDGIKLSLFTVFRWMEIVRKMVLI